MKQTILAIALTFAATQAEALVQRTTPLTVTPSAKRNTSANTFRRSSPIGVQFLHDLIGALRLDADQRERLVNDLAVEVRKDVVNLTIVSDRLQEAGMSVEQMQFALRLIRATGGREAPETALLASATGSGTTDRLYTSVEVFRFVEGGFSIRFVTSVAVSNAEPEEESTPATPNETDLFRRRTAELLTAVQDGGPFAVHIAWSKTQSLRPGLDFDGSLAAAIAKTGTINGGDGVTGGSHLELKLFAHKQPFQTGELSESITATLRGGVRYARGGLLSDLPDRTLWFAQLVLEARPRFSKVPIGFALTTVNRFDKYGVGFQVFGITGL